MTDREEALKWLDMAETSLERDMPSQEVISILRKALQAKEQEWKSIDIAPHNETLFVCRKKSKPQITFEAFFTWEDEGYESNVKPYWLLYNETMHEPIDEYYEDYEWTDLIKE